MRLGGARGARGQHAHGRHAQRGRDPCVRGADGLAERTGTRVWRQGPRRLPSEKRGCRRQPCLEAAQGPRGGRRGGVVRVRSRTLGGRPRGAASRGRRSFHETVVAGGREVGPPRVDVGMRVLPRGEAAPDDVLASGVAGRGGADPVPHVVPGRGVVLSDGARSPEREPPAALALLQAPAAVCGAACILQQSMRSLQSPTICGCCCTEGRGCVPCHLYKWHAAHQQQPRLTQHAILSVQKGEHLEQPMFVECSCPAMPIILH